MTAEQLKANLVSTLSKPFYKAKLAQLDDFEAQAAEIVLSKVLRTKFGGLSLEQLQDLAKTHYPEYFI